MSSRRLVVSTVGIAAAGVIAYIIYRNRPDQRVSRLVALSARQFRAKDYDASLKTALEALALANGTCPRSSAHLGALLHLAGYYGAVNLHDEGLSRIEELLTLTKDVHGADSLLMLPALHAKAELLESSGRPLAEVAESLGRAREIRRKSCGEASIDSAFASFNLASCLLRGAAEEGIAEGTLKALLSQASGLAMEACSIARVLGELDQAAEFASQLLDALAELDNIDAATLAGRLRDVYLDATGEEWREADDEPSPEEEDADQS